MAQLILETGRRPTRTRRAETLKERAEKQLITKLRQSIMNYPTLQNNVDNLTNEAIAMPDIEYRNPELMAGAFLLIERLGLVGILREDLIISIMSRLKQIKKDDIVDNILPAPPDLTGRRRINATLAVEADLARYILRILLSRMGRI